MKLYQAFDVDEETPVQFLAVHTLRWKPEWGEPSIMFREVDDETQSLADAAPALLEACKPFAALAEAIERMPWDDDHPVWAFDGVELTAGDFRRAREVIAQAERTDQ